jgi:hypothetical protein
MKPAKAVSFFFYTIVSIAAIGVSASHLWNVRKEWITQQNKPASLLFTLSGGSR